MVVRRDGDEDVALLDAVPGRTRACRGGAAQPERRRGARLRRARLGVPRPRRPAPSRRRQPRLARAADSEVPMLTSGSDEPPASITGIKDDGRAPLRASWAKHAAQREVASPACPRSLPAPRTRSAAPHNWIQLAKFGVVGATGFVDQPRRLRRRCSGSARTRRRRDLVRRLRGEQLLVEPALDVRATRRATSASRGCASSSSRCAAFAVNQFWLLVFLDWLGWGKIVSQAIAIMLVTPLNFLGNKLWSFRR